MTELGSRTDGASPQQGDHIPFSSRLDRCQGVTLSPVMLPPRLVPPPVPLGDLVAQLVTFSRDLPPHFTPARLSHVRESTGERAKYL